MNKLNQQLAIRLGIAGLIPFILLSLSCWLVHPDWLGHFIKGQLSYGIGILSFLGGIHWGAALLLDRRDDAQSRQSLIWGVIPSVIAWFSMTYIGTGFLVQMVAFIVAYKVDKGLYTEYQMPAWFLQLRYKLTVLVLMALLSTFIAANVRVYIP